VPPLQHYREQPIAPGSAQYKWRQRFLEGGKAALNGRKAEAQTALEQENRQLKEALAEAVR
jgi:hypothetical protein